MFKRIILKNWKSFRHAVLPLDPLTVVIGINSSGKSNAVEALDFLRLITLSNEIKTDLISSSSTIRGGVNGIAFKPETRFTIEALIEADRENSVDFLYTISLEIEPNFKNIQIYNESLIMKIDREEKIFFETLPTNSESLEIKALVRDYLSGSEKTEKLLSRQQSILNQVKTSAINTQMHFVFQKLRNIFIFNPEPSKMRNYSVRSDTLQSDGSNIAGVLADLPDSQKTDVENTLLKYIQHLPEKDIKKVWGEVVGRLGKDAMLYCTEEWQPGKTTEIDATTMSDGTLRFIAIITALLTRPQKSQIVIEDVDNGLHPSRIKLLLRMLKEIGEQREIDILVTTHNPALLDALEPEMMPFVIVAYRDPETGESKLIPLEEIVNFPKLYASNSIGEMVTKGAVERSFSRKISLNK
jgi:predicted ATPase